MKLAPVADTINNGALHIDIREYADGRYGFDFTPPGGGREKIRAKRLGAARAKAREFIGTTNAGKLDRLEINEEDFKAFIRWQSQQKEGAKIPILVKSFIESRAAKGVTRKHRKGLEGTLGHFAAAFPGDLGQLSREGIIRWLNHGGVSPRRWNNKLAMLSSMVRFARKTGLIGTDLSPVEMIDRKRVSVKVQTYTPEEMKTMLEKCPRDWIPHLVFGAFCGLRPEETCPDHKSEKPALTWENVDWRRGKVVIPAEVAKDRRKRFAPLTTAARAFLLPWKGKTGRVAPKNRTDRAFKEFKRTNGVDWRADALRHSFASYRLAETENAPALSLAMGNSPAMIFKHYLDLKHPADAKKWFGIRPKKK